MKYATTTLIVLAVAFAAPAAFASCPDQNGPYVMWWGSYYTFTFDTSCASTSGSPGSTTMWCYNSPAYQFNGSSGADYSMTVPTGLGGSRWSVSHYVEMNSTYSLDGLYAIVTVYHNGSVSSSNTYFIHNGNQGSLSCAYVGSSFFSAADGDTITVSMGGVNYTSATMQQTPPIIFSN
jgi:hypothetical protein